MSDIRIAPRRGYTVVPNGLLPEGISARAWGIYVYLLSRPPGWICRPTHLTRVFKEGRDAIYTAIHELVACGLMGKEEYEDNGLTRSRFVLGDPVQIAPVPDFQEPDSPEPGKPDSSHSRGVVTTEVPISCSPAQPASVDVGTFEEFWEFYPRKVGKATAQKAFTKALDLTTPDRLIIAASSLAHDPNLPEMAYIPYPATWLNRGGWDDAPYPSRTSVSAKVAEQDAIFGPAAEHARARMALEEARIDAERAAQHG